MDRITRVLTFPFKAASTLVKILGRIAVGVAGFVLMGLGLLLIEPFGILYIGLPVVAIGLLLLVKAIF